MKRPRFSIHVQVIFVVGTVFFAAAARSQSYGDRDQVLTLGVSAFRGVLGAQAAIEDDGEAPSTPEEKP